MPDLTSQPPLYHGLAVHQYQAADDRRLTELLGLGEGVGGPTEFQVAATSPASMAVRVFPGRALVKGDNVARQGTYMLEETTTLTVPIAENLSGNPRVDLVVLRDYDAAADGGAQASDRGTVEVIQGTPAPSPAPPALPASAIALAWVRVNAGAGMITAANITNRRMPLPGRRVAAGMHSTTGAQSIPGGAAATLLTFTQVGSDPWGLCDLTTERINLLPQGPSGLWLVQALVAANNATEMSLRLLTSNAAEVHGGVGEALAQPGGGPAIILGRMSLTAVLRTTGAPPDASVAPSVGLEVINWAAGAADVYGRMLTAVYLGPE